MMPLLQLTDDQKGKAMNAIYQQQMTAADPATLMANPAAAVAPAHEPGRADANGAEERAFSGAVCDLPAGPAGDGGRGGEFRRRTEWGNNNGGGQAAQPASTVPGYSFAGQTGTAQVTPAPATTPAPASLGHGHDGGWGHHERGTGGCDGHEFRAGGSGSAQLKTDAASSGVLGEVLIA